MTPIVYEWILKAEEDFGTIEREILVEQGRPNNLLCFLAQQTVEKYVKAVLQHLGEDIPRTHDLPYLLSLCLSAESDWGQFRDELQYLTEFAVDYRYPGAFATEEEADRAVDIARQLRTAVRTYFGM